MEYPFKDLLPIDEVLEREGYYKDWTHLDPEVFYSLTQISEYIKTKGFGVDVRLLIAQLAEHFGLKTAQVVDLGNLLQAEHTSLKQQVKQAVAQVNADRNALETQFNQSVAQMEADKNAVIANATVDSEVILARGGKATLGERLDDTTAQLAQTEQDMLNFANYSRPVEDAIYSWWISPIAITKNSKTFASQVSSEGSMSITCFDHDKKTMQRTEVAKFERNDHNALSINFMRDGRVVVFYARHNADWLVRCRISTKPYDISEFGEEITHQCSSGVTYVQSFDSGQDQYLRVIYRTGVYKWGNTIFNRDTGTFDLAEKIWLDAGTGQYYVLAMPYADGSRRTRLFMYGHPILDPSKNHVRYGAIQPNGQITTIGGATLANIDLDGNLPTNPTQYHLSYTPESGTKMRMFDVAISATPKFVFCDFTDGHDSTYKEAVWNGTTFDVLSITDSGRAIEEPVGKNYYFGGISYNKRNENEVYLTKEDSGIWSLERWIKENDEWKFAELLDQNEDKIFRPYSVFNNTSDMELTYIKGRYDEYRDYRTNMLRK